MAEVFRVSERTTGRPLALKRLSPDEKGEFAPHVVQLFEHEFHTLAQLVHPRIIEAYDYSRDERGPYYTMELLDGGDLRGLAPLPWERAVRLLCDVCSALSLLHSRRLIHRDLTPHNIRCTYDGNAKLFDFGSMLHMGVSKHIVGTAPFVPPEALAGQVLDARTDLFALGATAYYALTGQNAYRARQLAELDEIWARPIVPITTYAPDVPPALEELIFALLQLSPADRPSSAAEVLERLSAIGGFSFDEGLPVLRSYLATPNLVGRDATLARVRTRLARAADSDGGTLLIQGAAGVGRSRMLDACALEAKLSGALVLRADARDASAGKWGAARALLRQLIDEAPELAQQALQAYGPVLNQIAPDLLDRLPALRELPDNSQTAFLDGPAELRIAALTSIRNVLFKVAAQRLLVVAVDDAEDLDEPSSALIALLSGQTRLRRLLLIATARDEALGAESAQKAVSLLISGAEDLRLDPLQAQETQQLLISLFGDVQNVRLLADRLHAVSAGMPGVIMHLARQLLDRAQVRYDAGSWILPSGFDVSALHDPQAERFAAPIHALSAAARELADAFAVSALRRATLEECQLLSGHGDPQRLLRELDELLHGEVFGREDGGYFLARPEFARFLLQALPTDKKAELHARAARVYAARKDEEFRTAQHWHYADQSGRALDLLVGYIDATRELRIRDAGPLFEYVQTLPPDWIATMHGLLLACDNLNRPKHERFSLQSALTGFATLISHAEAKHTRDMMKQLEHDAGLDLYASMRDEPEEQRLSSALARAVARYACTPAHERVLSPEVAIPRLAEVLIQAVGIATRTMDLDLLVNVPSLAPLTPLSPALELVHKTVLASCDVLTGRHEAARHTFLAILERLRQPDRASLAGSYHQHLSLAITMAVAQLELAQGLPSAEDWAPTLEADPSYAVTALRLRHQEALMVGDQKRADELRIAAERKQIQNSPAQIFEGMHLWTQALALSDTDDLLHAKECAAETERMARQFPNWRPCLHFARGVYQALRGDCERALQALDHALELAPLGQHMAGPAIASRRVQLLVRNGRYEVAAASARAALSATASHGPDRHSSQLWASLAVAEAALGEREPAAQHGDRAVEELELRGCRGVVLGYAYEMRARVAFWSGDRAGCAHYASLCSEQYRVGEHAALTARYTQLLRDAAHAGIVLEGQAAQLISARDPGATALTRDLLRGCRSAAERAQRMLELLAEPYQAVQAFLYTVQREGPTLSAQVGPTAPPPELERFATLQLAAAAESRSEVATIVHQRAHRKRRAKTGEHANLLPIVLCHDALRGQAVTGIAVICITGVAPAPASQRLISALSMAMWELGDVARYDG